MIGNVFTLKQLEAFIWVADLQSFRKAAQHLNTTQPNISARISGLESTLNVVLMHRDGGSVRLTEKGHEVLRVARDVVRVSEGIVEVAQRPDLVEGRLRLGVTELVACTWLYRYLRLLRETYPAVNLELTVDLSRNLDKELSGRTLDLAIQTAPFSTPASGVIELGKYPYVWACSEDLDLDTAKTHSLADLLEIGVLTHARHTQAFIELNEEIDRQSLPRHRIMPSNSMTACINMARDALGVALLPDALVTREAQTMRLVRVPVDWTPLPLRFAARYDAERASSFLKFAAKQAVEVAEAYQRDEG